MDDFWRKEEKLAWLRDNPIRKIAFESITPDEKHNWINQTDNDWNELVPLIDKDVKMRRREPDTIFEQFSLGVVTARDEWVYDHNIEALVSKVQFLIECYNKDRLHFSGKNKEAIRTEIGNRDKRDIKWSRAVINDISNGKPYDFEPDSLAQSLYRPFVKMSLYFAKELNEMQYQLPHLISHSKPNIFITFVTGNRLDLSCLATHLIPNYAIYSLDPAQGTPLYRYDSDGKRQDNITDWAVEEFARRGASGLTKEDIFHYVYAVLHYPPYREKYAQNLKREFPRIPVYENAKDWAAMGKQLMDLHITYETAEPYPLKRSEPGAIATGRLDTSSGKKNPVATAGGTDLEPFVAKARTRLIADKVNGIIEIDTYTRLEGVPAIAWEYKLGNRSALEWVLDQYKERKPKDPTIAEKFNTYKFGDYKEHVIDLLNRVCTVSVKTMEIVRSMTIAPF